MVALCVCNVQGIVLPYSWTDCVTKVNVFRSQRSQKSTISQGSFCSISQRTSYVLAAYATFTEVEVDGVDVSDFRYDV